jgi:hypothetical protein
MSLQTKKYLIYQYYRHVPNTGKTINVGYNYYDFSKSSIRAYAANIGVEYRFIDKEIPVSPFYGIFLPFTEGWCHEYDAVCFIDSDILATQFTPNIFEYASDELLSIHLMTYAKPSKTIVVDDDSLDYFKEHGIFNSGVVVFPREVYQSFIDHTESLKEFHESITPVHESIGSLDQAFINFHIKDVLKDYYNLDKKFNYNLSRNQFNTRLSNYFVHYHRNFKKYIQSDYYNPSVIKGDGLKIQSTVLLSNESRVIQKSSRGKVLDRKTAISYSNYKASAEDFNQNVVIKSHTKPYVTRILFDERSSSNIHESEFFFKDQKSQRDANLFYDNEIMKSINDKISMYYETKPKIKKIPDKYVLVALYDKEIQNNAQKSYFYEENINMAKYGKLIADILKIPLLIKPHPLTSSRDSHNLVGYLSQDNFTIVENNICDLLDRATVVLTSRSRVGMESIMRLKKTIIFDDELSYQEVCHRFTSIQAAINYISHETLDVDMIKRYIFSYFVDFLKYHEEQNDET